MDRHVLQTESYQSAQTSRVQKPVVQVGGLHDAVAQSGPFSSFDVGSVFTARLALPFLSGMKNKCEVQVTGLKVKPSRRALHPACQARI